MIRLLTSWFDSTLNLVSMLALLRKQRKKIDYALILNLGIYLDLVANVCIVKKKNKRKK